MKTIRVLMVAVLVVSAFAGCNKLGLHSGSGGASAPQTAAAPKPVAKSLSAEQALNPSKLTSLAFWVAADSLKDLKSGDPVLAWQDQSPLKHNLAQADAAKAPTFLANEAGGKPAVHFEGVGKHLLNPNVMGKDLSAAQATSLFVVVKLDTSNSSGDGFSWGDCGQNRMILQMPVNNGIVFSHGHPNTGTLGSGFPSADWGKGFHVVSVVRNGGVSTITFDGLLARSNDKISGTLDVSMPGKLFVGTAACGNSFKGDIAEVVVANTNVTPEQQVGVETYLALKYGIPFFTK